MQAYRSETYRSRATRRAVEHDVYPSRMQVDLCACLADPRLAPDRLGIRQLHADRFSSPGDRKAWLRATGQSFFEPLDLMTVQDVR